MGMRRGLGLDCGTYPAASSYASAPFTPLTPEQSARYNADRAVFDNCLAQSQGAPACPAGSSFIGDVDPSGKWVGSCVSTTTGRPISDTGAPLVIPTDTPVVPAALSNRGGRVALSAPAITAPAPFTTRTSMPPPLTPILGNRGSRVILPTSSTTGTTTPARSRSAAPSSAQPAVVNEDAGAGGGTTLLLIAAALLGGYLLLGHKS